MEKKTNKAKFEIIKFLRKSAKSIKLADIVPSMEIQNIALTRVFLHAEFISAKNRAR